MRGALGSASVSPIAAPSDSSNARCSGRGTTPVGNHGSRSGIAIPILEWGSPEPCRLIRLLDRRERPHGGSRRAGDGVDDELTGADQEATVLLRVRDRAALDDALEHAALAPDDREHPVVADLERLPP